MVHTVLLLSEPGALLAPVLMGCIRVALALMSGMGLLALTWGP